MVNPSDIGAPVALTPAGTVKTVKHTTPRCTNCNKFCTTMKVMSKLNEVSGCCGSPLLVTMNCKSDNIIGFAMGVSMIASTDQLLRIEVDVCMNGQVFTDEKLGMVFSQPGMVCKFYS